jgi:integrase/recombinase XerD
MHWDAALEGYWLARRRDFSPHTIMDYERTFKRFGEFTAAGVEVKRIKKRDIDAFLNHLADDLELSPKTVANHWIALSSFWSWAADELGVPQIMQTVRRPRVQARIVQPYSQEEVEKLIATAGNIRAADWRNKRHVLARLPTAERDHAMLLILLDTGIRAAELCALRVRDCDRKAGRLSILEGKGGKQRQVYLGQAAQRSLWRYLAGRPALRPDDPLIANGDGTRCQAGAIGKHIARIGKRAGVADAGAHRFRHTFAINFLRNGGHLLALQDILGHATMLMVRRYARLAEVDIAAAQRAASPADKWKL